jgi:hypothetical protein
MRSRRLAAVTVLAGCWTLACLAADTLVETADGRRVILHDDFTWEYAEGAGGPAASPSTGEETQSSSELPALDSIFSAEQDARGATPAGAAAVPGVEHPAVLAVTQRKPMRTACRFGLTLTNKLPFLIRNIVPQFLAFNADDVMYQRVFQAWTGVRPTKEQYKEIQFDGITCDQIAYIKVAGGGRCEMGDLTKFSSTHEECLAHIEVAESNLVKIYEEPGAAIGSE